MNKDKFLKKVVKFCIGFIVFYTLLQITLSYFVQVELSPTLTTCVYAFFGTELVSSTFIRIFKEKYYKDLNDNENNSDEEMPDIEEPDIAQPDIAQPDILQEQETVTAEDLIEKLNKL